MPTLSGYVTALVNAGNGYCESLCIFAQLCAKNGLTNGKEWTKMANMGKKKQREYRGTIAGVLAEKMTYGQTVTFLGVSRRTLGKWVRAGTVPHYRIGGRVYFDEGQLFNWLESCRRNSDE